MSELKSIDIRQMFSKARCELLLVFLAVFLIYISNLYYDYKKDLSKNGNDLILTHDGYRNTLTSVDNVPNVFLPYLILEKHTIYFDSILNVVKRFEDLNAPHPYFLLPTDGGLISVYPLASAFISLPFYVLPFLLKNPDLNFYENIMLLLVISRVVAAFITAISVALMYLAISKISNRKWLNLLLVAFFAFGTPLFTIASRGLWMHTTSLLLISLLIYILLKNELNKRSVFWMSLLMGVLVLIRLTNIIIVIPVGLYLLIQNKKNLFPVLLGGLPAILTLMYTNFLFYGSVLSNGYVARDDFHWTTSYLESLPGYFVSPARGFLFLTPLLLIGFSLIFKFNKLSLLYKMFMAICLIQILVMGKWWAWEGANAFGARMLTEIIPFLFVLTVEVVKNVKHKILLALMIVLVVYSILIHSIGVFNKKSRCAELDNWNFNCLVPLK